MQPEELESARRSGGDFHSRALFLFAAAFMILLGHLFDVLQVHGPNWLALAVRTGWAALLVANGLAAFRAPYPALKLLTLSANLTTSLLFVALLAVTGRTSSPLFPYSYVLVILLPLFLPEFLAFALCSSTALSLGTLALLLIDHAGAGALLAWAHTSAFAIITGALLGRAHQVAQLARRHQAEARKAALGQAAENEGLAALGRIARQVAHDINNPLSVARCNASFIQQAPNLDPEVPSAWRDLLSALNRIAGSVRLLQSGPNLPRRE